MNAINARAMLNSLVCAIIVAGACAHATETEPVEVPSREAESYADCNFARAFGTNSPDIAHLGAHIDAAMMNDDPCALADVACTLARLEAATGKKAAEVTARKLLVDAAETAALQDNTSALARIFAQVNDPANGMVGDAELVKAVETHIAGTEAMGVRTRGPHGTGAVQNILVEVKNDTRLTVKISVDKRGIGTVKGMGTLSVNVTTRRTTLQILAVTTNLKRQWGPNTRKINGAPIKMTLKP